MPWLQARLDEAGQRAQFDPDAASPARAASGLEVPLLLIHGASDTQVPPAHARALNRAASGSKLVLIEGETHASMLGTAAPRVEAETLAFLESSKRRQRD